MMDIPGAGAETRVDTRYRDREARIPLTVVGALGIMMPFPPMRQGLLAVPPALVVVRYTKAFRTSHSSEPC
jgi:hypothetical protein